MAAPAADFILPFGKLHKGKPLSAIPKAYLIWCLDNMTSMYPDTRAAIETYVGRSMTLPGTERPATERKRSPRASTPSAEAPTPRCHLCGGAATDGRPLVHEACAKDDVPF